VTSLWVIYSEGYSLGSLLICFSGCKLVEFTIFNLVTLVQFLLPFNMNLSEFYEINMSITSVIME
jgi:hypothetical protein